MWVLSVYVFSSPLKGEETEEGGKGEFSPHPSPLPQRAREPQAALSCPSVTPDLTKPSGMRLGHEGCHPERSEGSRSEILRSAQNDSPEGLHYKVYECCTL